MGRCAAAARASSIGATATRQDKRSGFQIALFLWLKKTKPITPVGLVVMHNSLSFLRR